MNNDFETISENNYADLIRLLIERDKDLAGVIETYGKPPIWIRPAGFPTLIHIILEQQVSISSALAAYERLKLRLGEITPSRFLTLTDEELRSIGLSRQKTLYTKNLANAIVNGELDLNALESLPDDAVKAELTKLKGIGRWTADVYLLMCLRRTDAFPVGDLGVIVGMQKLKNLLHRPTSEELEIMSEAWKPLRAVATRILWHFYLSPKPKN
jgi:DNA-3-methyladenine glycosylase II